MYATSVRAFSKSAVRMNATGGNTPASKWFGTFFGVSAVLGVFGVIFYKANETNAIKENFAKTGINQKK